jgi:hypothetical protein
MITHFERSTGIMAGQRRNEKVCLWSRQGGPSRSFLLYFWAFIDVAIFQPRHLTNADEEGI